ncbi:DUF6172 family protein [Arcobacter sp. YIC-464]|uniref:DUF6172 family protein n=1 Tax=Arcobacter sp. YIC-464 TaxID=3376631 RepID=UPI003C1DB7E4
MKKTFKLEDGRRHPDRIIDAIKYEVRKYIKREKKKKLPENVDFWKFECKSSINGEEPQHLDFLDITKAIDNAASSKAETLYLEILATPGIKEKKSEQEDSE